MKKLFCLFASAFILTSCSSSFWEGMAQGMGGYRGYGGYGMAQGVSPMGGTFIGPVYCPPINTQAVQQAANMARQQAVQNIVENAKTTQQVKAQIEAQAAYNVQHGITPVTVDNSSSYSSSSSTSSPSSSSSSSSSHKIQYGYKDCTHCMGSGKCGTCNGTGIQNHMNNTLCGVCSNHNGKCIWCSGSGKRYGAL